MEYLVDDIDKPLELVVQVRLLTCTYHIATSQTFTHVHGCAHTHTCITLSHSSHYVSDAN